MDWYNLDQLLSTADLPDVAHRLGLQSQQNGDRHLALCPFHADTKPSLRLFPKSGTTEQHYHCFSCNAHGDAISLVKQVQGSNFEEAVQWLASTFSVLPERRTKQKTGSSVVPVHNAIDFASRVFDQSHNDANFTAWCESRGHSSEYLYNLGFRSISRNCLVDKLSSMPLNDARPLVDKLEELGLLRRIRKHTNTSDKSQFLPLNDQVVDAFSDGRIIIPIKDQAGNIVGYTARKIQSGNSNAPLVSAKYLNSKGLQKGKYFFNFNDARTKLKNSNNDTQRKLYIVEGLMDAVRLSSLGIPAVALMGTSLSEDQVSILSNLSDTFVHNDLHLTFCLFLDSDSAGRKAASRVSRQLLTIPTAAVLLIDPSGGLISAENEPQFKDPDELLRKESFETIDMTLSSFEQPSIAAIIAEEFGARDLNDIKDTEWEQHSPYRRDKAIFATVRLIRPLLKTASESSWTERLTSNWPFQKWPLWLKEVISVLSTTDKNNTREMFSTLFLEKKEARVNHARALAFHGSRRGELPSDEPIWLCLDIGASIFNTILLERLHCRKFTQSAPWDALYIPRKLTSNKESLADARLKVMPHPADLTFQQYLLNELLTERHDYQLLGASNFSKEIPAVRYYRSLKRTTTTGFSQSPDEDVPILSFAYQIDMEVVEGTQIPSDQGMFRPYIECWRDFMESLDRQIHQFDIVHTLRLDVKRYYDNIRRYIVRDLLHSTLSSALATDWPESLTIIREKGGIENLINIICDSSFNFQYADPTSGQNTESEINIGIPQGPVLSAWIGTFALFPVDKTALEMMEKYTFYGEDGKKRSRIGYARYVDDIVLVADSAELLQELRVTVQEAASKLELTLLSKGKQIPPGTPNEVSKILNEGTVFFGSVPTWEPPLFGDGEWGWALGDESETPSRQSALSILRNPQLVESPDIILGEIKNAIFAPDLRPSDLAKCARLIWFKISLESQHLEDSQCESKQIWDEYWNIWNIVTGSQPWAITYNQLGYSDLIALEGIDRLLDREHWMDRGLGANKREYNRSRLKALAKCVSSSDFFPGIGEIENKFHLKKRRELISWKAREKLGKHKGPKTEKTEFSDPRSLTEWFCQATALLLDHSDSRNNNSPFAPIVNAPLDESSLTSELVVASLVKNVLCEKGIGEHNNEEESHLARHIALGLILNATPREEIWSVLQRYPDLLNTDSKLRFLPPIPGIYSPHLFGYYTNPKNKTSPTILNAFCVEENRPPISDFYGVSFEVNLNPASLKLNWKSTNLESNQLWGWTATPSIDLSFDLSVLQEEINEHPTFFAAKLFHVLFEIYTCHNFPISEEKSELVPILSHLAVAHTERKAQSFYLIAASIPSDHLGSTAWVQDGTSKLRSVSVPSGNSHLWRIGCTVSDLLGFSGDVLNHSDDVSRESDGIFSLGLVEQYVLRQQLRKLRGELISNAVNLQNDDTDLPVTIKRALEILGSFPKNSATNCEKVFALLESETETCAMAMRINSSSSKSSERFTKEFTLKDQLHEIPIRVFRKIDLNILEALNIVGLPKNGMRRDLAITSSIAATIVGYQGWGISKSKNDSKTILKYASALAVASVGFRGVFSSIIGLEGSELPQDYWLPDDWPIPVKASLDLQSSFERVRSVVENELWGEMSKLTAWDWLVATITTLKKHLLNTEKFEEQLKNLETIYVLLKGWEESPASSIDGQTQWSWPYEDFPNLNAEIGLLTLIELVPETIASLDNELGFEVTTVMGSRYGLNRNDNTFVDSHSRTWRMHVGQYSELPSKISSIEYAERDGEILKVWTEVRNSSDNNRLLSVHVIDEKFAKLVRASTESGSSTESPLQAHSTVSVNSGTSPDLEPSSSKKTKSADQSLPPTSKFRTKIDWKMLQTDSWKGRGVNKQKSDARIALFQWRVDETYSHPLIEAGLNGLRVTKKLKLDLSKKLGNDGRYQKVAQSCARESEHLWDESSNLFSWPEYRRRKLLTEALESCRKLAVDLLVLPEYSVREETVNWLQGELRNFPGMAVLAGTFKDPQKLNSQLTLLWMPPRSLEEILMEKGQHITKALSFKRDKKYRAVAVGEFFRPPKGNDVLLEPLFKPTNLIDGFLEQIPAVKDRLTPQVAGQIIFDKMPVLRYCLELICSELFILGPGNLYPLVRELAAMKKRFNEHDLETEDIVLGDVKSLARYLDINCAHTESRRSILLVPSATGRTSDYWTAGQANVLASSTATVFCNAVSGTNFQGGSCFIGNESTSRPKTNPGMIDRITPYHGWSKGIYYGDSDSPLSTKDQALVVVDLNPVHVVEGKPRPQLMSHPLQLVAYLPVVEALDIEKTLDSMSKFFSDRFECTTNDRDREGLKDALTALQLAKPEEYGSHFTKIVKLLSAKEPLTEASLKDFSKLFCDEKAITNRLLAWTRSRHQQPVQVSGSLNLPPALLDCVVVDLTLTFGTQLPDLLVPSWSGN